MQDGTKVPVAVKTCRVDSEDSVGEKLLEEARECCELLVYRLDNVFTYNSVRSYWMLMWFICRYHATV